MIKDCKICGISDPETLNFIINHSNSPKFVGFICNYPKSSRYIKTNDLKNLLNVMVQWKGCLKTLMKSVES